MWLLDDVYLLLQEFYPTKQEKKKLFGEDQKKKKKKKVHRVAEDFYDSSESFDSEIVQYRQEKVAKTFKGKIKI